MVSWNVYCFECGDVAAREALMEHFSRNHPVDFPNDRYSVFAEVETPEGSRGADYAWLDRYLYVTVMGEAGGVVRETADLWERACYASFDGTTETATDVMLIVDMDAGAEDEAAGVKFSGMEGLGGNDVLYALAMAHQFRFRSYSAQSPTNQITPHPAAFDAIDGDDFVSELAELTGIEPTDEGLAFLREDPADDDRYVYGETYGPEDGASDDGVDAVRVVDERTGEVTTYEDPADVPADDEDGGLLSRIRALLGG